MSHHIKLLLRSISVSFWLVSNVFWCRVSILVWFLTVSPHRYAHYCLLPWVISSVLVSLPCVRNPWNNSLCVYISIYLYIYCSFVVVDATYATYCSGYQCSRTFRAGMKFGALSLENPASPWHCTSETTTWTASQMPWQSCATRVAGRTIITHFSSFAGV